MTMLHEHIVFNRFLPSRATILCLPLLGIILVGCSPYGNKPFHETDPSNCSPNECNEHTYLEKHDTYDLAYVEFTERGNVFDRDRMQRVLNYVSEQAGHGSEDSNNNDPKKSVLAVVFIHGWKHNARTEDENVKNFRNLLSKASQIQSPVTKRRMIGIYIGWRGLSVNLPLIIDLSFWERKAVAQQVGKGGVTEFLLRLEKSVIDDKNPNRNILLVTGHSFGGAIVLSALNEVFLERIVDAQVVKTPSGDCLKTRPFGHGVVLLNPAIEANEALQLKERVAELAEQRPFCHNEVKLMHVISSEADIATNSFFPLGQSLGVNLRWKQATLKRKLGGKDLDFEESKLDTTTVGNFSPFWTGRLKSTDDSDRNWKYTSCVEKESACLESAAESKRIPVGEHIRAEHNEPLSFIHTDENFIAEHNDVFNNNVSAYLAAIIAEARYKRDLDRQLTQHEGLPENCHAPDFNFGSCFEEYQSRFFDIDARDE